MTLSLDALNAASPVAFVQSLAGLYEHSPWIPEQVAARRPFPTVAALRQAMVEAVRAAGIDAQRTLLRAHPELAGKAMVDRSLTAESSGEQRRAGLTACTPEEFDTLQRLNADYNAKFGFPFILAVRGPRGTGLDRSQVISTFARRLGNHPDDEFAEALRNVHRIAEIRLGVLLGVEPALGNALLDRAAELAVHSDPGFAERGELTVTYLTDAHLAVGRQLAAWMRETCGFDDVATDAVGNVVGVYHGSRPEAPRLLTGSHYDTVRNGGRYDGRLGILAPMLAVRELAAAGRRLPFGIEVVGFAEEEGQRYKATFLGSGALLGRFDPAWLEQLDADGVSMRDAMRRAGLRPEDIASIRRDPSRYLGFVELHIEQGPVMEAEGIGIGAVENLQGISWQAFTITGQSNHAGTTPMRLRRDAGYCAAAIAVFVRELAQRYGGGQVATVGAIDLHPNLINVIAARATVTVDLRNTDEPTLQRAERELADFVRRLEVEQSVSIEARRLVRFEPVVFHDRLVRLVEHRAVARGLHARRMTSGAGHDAQMMARICPSAMIFVPSVAGISHNPREHTEPADLLRGANVLLDVLVALASES